MVGQKRVDFFPAINGLILILFSLIMIYPFLYTINLSISDAVLSMQGGPFFTPNGFSLDAYRTVFTSEYIYSGYRNTLFVTSLGTVMQVSITALFAYPLSKKRLKGYSLFNRLVVFTMLFNGGLIPTFLVVKATGLYNSLFAMIVPLLITPFNAIILRNFFANVPESLEESARIDGANDFVIFLRIIVPLSTAAIATISLWCAVALWNEFFTNLIYIRDRSKYVVQLVLREIVNAANPEDYLEIDGDQFVIPETVRAAAIMVVTVPILCVYPFIQKYFVKGVMIGSIKG
jgi:putative aldouronate transport system permease protein